jgi:[ribosomal protein S5]-alanine N-acetyltransferase
MCVLETTRLRLKPTQANDLEIFYRILVDPFVRRYLCDDRAFSREKAVEMLNENLSLFMQERFGLWLIELKAVINQNAETKREVIGFTGLWYFFGEPQPQLVYALLPELIGQGFATEAAQAVIGYCFENLGFSYLIASCDYLNLDSQKLAFRLGMVEVEIREIDNQSIVFFLAQNPNPIQISQN